MYTKSQLPHRHHIRGLALVFAFGLAMPLGGCGAGPEEDNLTPAEKERRQELALDLAGDWVTATGEGQPTRLKIENEVKTYDIRVGFELGRPLNASEAGAVDRAVRHDEPRMDDREVEALLHHLEAALQTAVLGEGATEVARGGENVVLDGEGAVSEVTVRSRSQTFHEIRYSGLSDEYRLVVTMYATAAKTPAGLTWRVTRNTDVGGMSADKRKGVRINIERRTLDGDGDVEKSSSVCELWLDLADFAPR